MPVAAIRNRMGDFRRTQRLAIGVAECGEDGIFERTRSCGRECRRIERSHDLALPHRSCGSKTGVAMHLVTCGIVLKDEAGRGAAPAAPAAPWSDRWVCRFTSVTRITRRGRSGH